MQEKELKFKIIAALDNQEIVNKIQSLGFKFVKTSHIIDTYFDDDNYSVTNNNEAWRKRNQDGIIQYSYKKKRKGKIYEDKISGRVFYEKTQNLKPNIIINKQRQIFVKNDCEIAIDNVKKIGVFLEIECRYSNPNTIREHLCLSGLSLERTKKGYTNMLTKNIKRGLEKK